ncbi:uncharacterized protein [Diadema antillarum]|uniref:uncharacterized protein n=1 Tax=Diadema antillarum TaxID=105358 RepID=UPI003A8AF521
MAGVVGHKCVIVQRGDDHDTGADKCDASVTNPWNWNWMEYFVDGKRLGESIRKIKKTGYALCILCNKELKYGKRGRKALEEHVKKKSHVAIENLRKGNTLLPGQKPPESSQDTSYGLHPAFRKTAANPTPTIPEPQVSLADRVSTAEASLLAFAAEKSLPYSVVPDLIDLSKSLAKDKQVLDRLSMDRTTASYKMTHGLGRHFTDACVKDLQESFFSLNIDECTSKTNKHVLSVLVCYYSKSQQEIVVKHLTSFEVIKVDSQSLYNELVKVFEEKKLPWENLISILMDSCNVMRGSKTGLETRIRTHKAPHLLDIDGDTCHHAHNAAKAFSEPFEQHIEYLLLNIYNDFKWSADKRELLLLICDALAIKGTMPERYVSHRWLSVYDVSVDTERMWDAYIIFYFSFLSDTERRKYASCVSDIFKKHQVDDNTQIALRNMQNSMKKKKMTKEGRERTNIILHKLFFVGPKTKVLLHIFTSVLPMLKSYVMLFQRDASMIHLLNDEQCDLLQKFLCCFMKPEKLQDISSMRLAKLQIDDTANHLDTNDIYLSRHIRKNLPSALVEEVTNKLLKAYIKCGTCLQKKMPLNNDLLKTVSAIDPCCRGHTATLKSLLKLPGLVTNVLHTEEENEQFDVEVRRYQLHAAGSEESDDIVKYWTRQSETFPHLTKMIFAILSCFHNPAVESSFSIMQETLNTSRPSIHIDSFSAVQTVKFELKSSKKTALQYFSSPSLDKPVNSTLCKNMRSAYQRYAEAKEDHKKERESHMTTVGVIKKKPDVSKAQAKLQHFKRAS